jgi:hypothetical protein
MIDRKKLAVIHIIKKELGLSEDKYRNILLAAAGVSTAKDLDEPRFRKLMRYFVSSKYYRLNDGGLTLRQKLYIQYLCRQLGWTDEHLSNFIHKYYHKERLESLSKKEAVKAIESLKQISLHQHKV